MTRVLWRAGLDEQTGASDFSEEADGTGRSASSTDVVRAHAQFLTEVS